MTAPERTAADAAADLLATLIEVAQSDTRTAELIARLRAPAPEVQRVARSQEAWSHECDLGKLTQGDYVPYAECPHCKLPAAVEDVTLWRVSESRPATSVANRWKDRLFARPLFAVCGYSERHNMWAIEVRDGDAIMVRIELPEWESFRHASAGHRMIEHGYAVIPDARTHEDPSGWTYVSNGGGMYVTDAYRINDDVWRVRKVPLPPGAHAGGTLAHACTVCGEVRLSSTVVRTAVWEGHSHVIGTYMGKGT